MGTVWESGVALRCGPVAAAAARLTVGRPSHRPLTSNRLAGPVDAVAVGAWETSDPLLYFGQQPANTLWSDSQWLREPSLVHRTIEGASPQADAPLDFGAGHQSIRHNPIHALSVAGLPRHDVLLVPLHLVGREQSIERISKKLSRRWIAVGPNLLDSLVTHAKCNPDRIASRTAFGARMRPRRLHRQARISCGTESTVH